MQFDNPNPNPYFFQQEDLILLGQLMLCMACGSLNALMNIQKSTDFVGRQYSASLKTVILFLLSKMDPKKKIDDVFAMMGTRILHELSSLQQ